jgi:hypothetical protein
MSSGKRRSSAARGNTVPRGIEHENSKFNPLTFSVGPSTGRAYATNSPQAGRDAHLPEFLIRFTMSKTDRQRRADSWNIIRTLAIGVKDNCLEIPNITTYFRERVHLPIRPRG